MQATNSRLRFEAVADGQDICSHIGAALLGELADRLGLTGELGRRANRGVRAGAHDRGQVLRNLVVMLADGGDCVSDLAALRDQLQLFGRVASTPTAWRVLAEELPADPRGTAALWSALAPESTRAICRRNLPFRGFAANDAWLTLVCVAQTLVSSAQALLLAGDLKAAEPKTLRYRLWHTAGRIVHHARRATVHLDRAWPWAADLDAACGRLRALPTRC